MAEKSKAIVKSSTALTRFNPKARKELVIRGLASLDEVRDADFYFFKGESHRIKGELRQAIDNYEKALRIDPQHEDSLFYMGYCYLPDVTERTSDGLELDEPIRHESAAEAFQKLIDIREMKCNPLWEYYATYYNLGHAQYNLGLYEEAKKNYEKAIKLNPEYADSYYNLGNAQFNLGLYEEAIGNYEEAIKLNPELSVSYHMLGSAQFNLGLYDEAIENYEEAIKLDPEDAESCYRLGNSAFQLTSYEEAIENCEKAIKLNPEYADSYYLLGLCQEKIDLDPEWADSYYLLGLRQEKIDLDHLVLENFEKFLSLDGDKADEHVEYAKRRVKQLKASSR